MHSQRAADCRSYPFSPWGVWFFCPETHCFLYDPPAAFSLLILSSIGSTTQVLPTLAGIKTSNSTVYAQFQTPSAKISVSVRFLPIDATDGCFSIRTGFPAQRYGWYPLFGNDIRHILFHFYFLKVLSHVFHALILLLIPPSGKIDFYVKFRFVAAFRAAYLV